MLGIQMWTYKTENEDMSKTRFRGVIKSLILYLQKDVMAKSRRAKDEQQGPKKQVKNPNKG